MRRSAVLPAVALEMPVEFGRWPPPKELVVLLRESMEMGVPDWMELMPFNDQPPTT